MYLKLHMLFTYPLTAMHGGACMPLQVHMEFGFSHVAYVA